MMYRMFGNSDDLDYFEKVMKKIKENTWQINKIWYNKYIINKKKR
jgi:hypothetical protein